MKYVLRIYFGGNAREKESKWKTLVFSVGATKMEVH